MDSVRSRKVEHTAMKQVIMADDGLVELLAVETVVTVGSTADDERLATRLVERHLLKLRTAQDILRRARTYGIES